MKLSRLLIILTASALILSSCSGSKNIVTDYSEYTQLDTISVIGTYEDLSYKPSEKLEFDLIHTKLDLSFDWENQHVFGEATLTLTPYFYEKSMLEIDAKGFDIHKLGMLEGEKVRKLDFEYDSSVISINLKKVYNRLDTFEIYIAYTAKPDLLVDKEPSMKDNKGLYFIDPLGDDPSKPSHIWTQSETESASCWYPTIDNPNQKTSQEIFLTVNDKYKTLSNGLLLSSKKNKDGTRTDYWKQKLPHAPYLFVVVVGDYAVVDDEWRDIEVDYYVEPEYEEHARAIFGNTPEMLEFYSNYLGVDYPWDKYHQVVVRDFVAGAMENTSATVHFEGLHMTERELIDSDHEDIIAHEVAHQWFGDLVTCESWANTPLNEAFATYGEYLWFEYKYGKETADLHHYRDLITYLYEAKTKQEPLIRYHYGHPDDMFDAHSYQKGGCVLHMLRNYVGEIAFRESLNRYLMKNAYKTAEIHDLRLAFEEVTGEDLNWFFNQWFLKPGHPVLDIDYAYFSDTTLITITQSASSSESGLYKLPIAIDIYTDDGVERRSVTINKKVTEIEIKAAAKPYLVNIDADKVLLCEKNDNKDINAWVYQYENAPLFYDRYEAVRFFEDNQQDELAYEALIKAMSDPFFKIRERALSYIEVKEKNKAKVIELIKMLALEDPNSEVRSEALYRLDELEVLELKGVINTALYDESYMVIGAALEVLADLDSTSAIYQANEHVDSESSDVQSAVAKIYSKLGSRDDYSYFETTIGNSSGFLKYYLLYYFGNYLGRMEIEEIRKGLPLLRENILNGQSHWIVTAAEDAIERIRVAYERKKSDTEIELKRVDQRDLAQEARLEENLKEAEAVLDLIDTTLVEINAMN